MAKQLTANVKTQVDAETLRRLQAFASKTDRSVGAVVRIAIRQYLDGKDTRP